MQNRQRRTAATAAVVSLAMVLAACGTGGDETDTGTDGGDEAQREGTLIYGEGTAFPENLFPSIAAGNSVATSNIVARLLPAVYILQPDSRWLTTKPS